MSLIYIEDIKRKSQELSLLNKTKINELNNFGLEEISMPEFIMPNYIDEDDDCDAFMLKMFSKESLLAQKNKIKEKIEIEFQNKLNDIIQLKNLVIEFWQKIKDYCNTIIKEFDKLYKDVISYFDSEFIKIKNLWKSLKKSSSQQDKKIKREKINSIIKEYGGEVLEMFGINELYYSIKELWHVLKNIWGNAKEMWNNLINNFKELKNMFKNNNTLLGEKIYNWTSNILVLLANIAIVTLAAIKNSKKEQIKKEKEANEIIEIINKEKNNKDNNSINESFLLSYHNKKNIENEKKDNKNNVSICSICPVIYNNTPTSDDLVGYALEIGLSINNFSLIKKYNDDIYINDIIGYINNKPIISKIEGKVTESNDRYLLIHPYENIDISTKISNSNIDKDKKEIEKIIESFNNLNKLESVIKDDICYTYKSIFANNIIIDINAKKITSNEKYENFLNILSEKVKKLEKDIKEKTNQNNIRNKLNKDNGLETLKNEIIYIKNNFFKEILHLISNNNFSYKSSIEENYKLIDYYYQFISNFDYDKDNQYKVELYNIILNFIQDRKKIESLNVKDIEKEINKNALQIQKNKNFFNSIKNKIKNLNNIEDIYNFIKNYCNINIIQEEKTLDTSNINSDFINNLLNSQSSGDISNSDKEKIKKEKIAKKIAILLHLLLEYNNKIINDNKSLKEQTKYECEILNNFYKKIELEYNKYLELTNEIYSFDKDIQWPSDSIIYIDNKKYTHYLFIEEKNKEKDNIINKEDGENPLSTKTQYESNTYKYWLKYCGMATLINCALPMYWGTGLVVAGVPVLMPIILVPIYVFKGNCTCVIGLGICGIAIYPMFLYSNMTEETMSYFLPINNTIDILKGIIKSTKETSKKIIKEKFNTNIKSIDLLIENTKNDIQSINKEIDIIKNF